MKPSFSFAIWLLWLALPFTALDYWRVWNQLPARMAIHFDINWRANGWASREAAFALMVGVVFFLVATFTIMLFLVRRAPNAAFMPWLVLAFFYATVIFVCGVNHWVIRYNLNQGTKNAHRVQNTSSQQISASSKLGIKN